MQTRKLYIALLILFFIPAAAKAQSTTTAVKKDSVTVSAAELADRLEAEARSLLGKPYSYGSRGPKAFDCSGFTGYVYSKFGYNLGRSSRDQAKDGRAVEGDLTNLQKGDILVFSGRHNSIGHVGMFLKMDKGGKSCSFIHAARGGVQISHTNEPYYAARFKGARRIIPDFVDTPTGDHRYTDEELENIVARKDTLSLGTGDRRIVLLADGSWMLVDAEGRLSKPVSDTTIVLGANGRWASKAISSVRIPQRIPGASSTTTTTKTVSPTDTTTVNKSGSVATTATDAVAETPEPVKAPEHQYYTIRQGDTLYKIASAHHTTVKALCSLNGIKETTILQIGRKLRIK